MNTVIPRPENEEERLAALRGYGLVDTPADTDFDFLTKMAATICGTPYAFVSLVENDRVWYKSTYGRSAIQTPRDEDYCSWSILEKDGLQIPDLSEDTRTANLTLTKSGPQYRMYCGANLTNSDGHRIGSLCVLDVVPRALDPEKFAILEQLANQVMSLIELRAKNRQLQEAYSIMERLATVDELTGLLNRRTLMMQLRKEIDRNLRTQSEFALVMIDIDHFKKINDNFGHLRGDAVLREIGQLITQRLRSTDCAGRYGGEELALALLGAGIDEAKRVAEELRSAIAETAYAEEQIRVTASFGIAVFRTVDAWSMDTLIDAADKALYRAKHSGRNRVEIFDQGEKKK